MNELQRLWGEHSAAIFPRGLAGMQVEGIDLASLDADITGCVATFARSGGTLDGEHIKALEVCHQNATKVAEGLSGEPRRYFERLRNLASVTLQYLKDRSGGGLTQWESTP